MLLREPEHHLVADEDAELLFELEFGLGEAAGDGHDGAREDALGRDGAHERLQVGRQPEGDRFRVVEDGFAGGHGGDELRTPDVACGAGDGEFVRVTVVHVHDVSHEGKCGELIRELTAEEPEVGKVGVDLLEVVEYDGVWNPFVLDRGESFHTEVLRLIGVSLCVDVSHVHRNDISDDTHVVLQIRQGPQFVHREQYRLVFIHSVPSAMILENPLQRDVRSIVLHQTNMRR